MTLTSPTNKATTNTVTEDESAALRIDDENGTLRSGSSSLERSCSTGIGGEGTATCSTVNNRGNEDTENKKNDSHDFDNDNDDNKDNPNHTIIMDEDDNGKTNPEEDDHQYTVERVDEVLFGSLNSILVDQFFHKINKAFEEGVSSLPLLSSTRSNEEEESPQQRLIQKLQKAYFRNVDIMEGYAKRNIFSIRNYTKSFRKRVCQEYQNNHPTNMNTVRLPPPKPAAEKEATTTNNPVDTQENKENNNNNEYTTNDNDVFPDKSTIVLSTSNANNIILPTSKEEIPTVEMMKQLQEEIYNLNLKLTQAKEIRNEKSKACTELEKAIQLSKEINQNNQSSLFPSLKRKMKNEDTTTTTNTHNKILLDRLHQSVTTIMYHQRNLNQLQSKGTFLLQEMETLNRSSSKRLPQSQEDDDEDNSENGDDFNLSQGSKQAKKEKRGSRDYFLQQKKRVMRMTVEEHYQHERKQMNGIHPQGLLQAKRLLSKK